LRSAMGAGASPTAGAGVPTAVGGAPTELPHSPQNLDPGSFCAPQTGHATASAVPHSMQNLRPGEFCLPQLGHVTTLGECRGARGEPEGSVARRDEPGPQARGPVPGSSQYTARAAKMAKLTYGFHSASSVAME
jgi:hypothetical protein